MQRAGRLGDSSHITADGHGGGCCAHAATGPATTASANVLINERAALRVGDRGRHDSCCGSNSWTAVAGAPCVLVNERRAHRLDDKADHCGGLGQLVTGSSNVLIGNWAGPSRTGKTELRIALLTRAGTPVPRVVFDVRGPVCFSGITAAEVLVYEGLPRGRYEVRFRTKAHAVPQGWPRRDNGGR